MGNLGKDKGGSGQRGVWTKSVGGLGKDFVGCAGLCTSSRGDFKVSRVTGKQWGTWLGWWGRAGSKPGMGLGGWGWAGLQSQA